tara:strand:- start:44 stop:334 length:291 start_codon:yes stop_codon:yes gene_type:complete
MITSTTSHYTSSTINSATYSFTDKTLTVVFKWATYVYEAVDVAAWINFNSADSQGKALNEFIKGEFEYAKYEEEVIKTQPGSLLDELPPADYQLDN